MNAVIGIDADSFQVAYAVLDPRQGGRAALVKTIPRKSDDGVIKHTYDERIDRLFDEARRIGASIYLEGIYLTERRHNTTRRNVQTFSVLAEVQGELKLIARRKRVRLVPVRASAWHKAVLGFTTPRDALKAAAIAYAKKHSGKLTPTEHESDAYCIARFALQSSGLIAA